MKRYLIGILFLSQALPLCADNNQIENLTLQLQNYHKIMSNANNEKIKAIRQSVVITDLFSQVYAKQLEELKKNNCILPVLHDKLIAYYSREKVKRSDLEEAMVGTYKIKLELNNLKRNANYDVQKLNRYKIFVAKMIRDTENYNWMGNYILVKAHNGFMKCPNCRGTGKKRNPDHRALMTNPYITCNKCSGSGKIKGNIPEKTIPPTKNLTKSKIYEELARSEIQQFDFFKAFKYCNISRKLCPRKQGTTCITIYPALKDLFSLIRLSRCFDYQGLFIDLKKIMKTVPCSSCNGTGKVSRASYRIGKALPRKQKCPSCNGTGVRRIPQNPHWGLHPLNKTMARAYELLGEVALLKNNHSSALKYFNIAMKLNPQNNNKYNLQLSEIYFSLIQSPDFVAKCKLFSSIKTASPITRYYNYENQYNMFFSYFKKAIANKNQEVYKQNLGEMHWTFGNIYFNEKEYTKAESAYKQSSIYLPMNDIKKKQFDKTIALANQERIEDRVSNAETIAKNAEDKAKDAEEKAKDAETMAKNAENKVTQAEKEAEIAALKLRQAEAKIRRLEEEARRRQ